MNVMVLVMLVIGLLIILEIIQDSFLMDTLNTRVAIELKLLETVYEDSFLSGKCSDCFDRYLDTWVKGKTKEGNPIIFLQLHGQHIIGTETDFLNYREYPREYMNHTVWAEDLQMPPAIEPAVFVQLSSRASTNRNAAWRLCVLITLACIVGSTSIGFFAHLRRTIVEPLEIMLNQIQSFANDPLRAIEGELLEQPEIKKLQQTLNRLGQLLQVAHKSFSLTPTP